MLFKDATLHSNLVISLKNDFMMNYLRGSRKASNVAIIENAAVQQESGTLNEDMDDS